MEGRIAASGGIDSVSPRPGPAGACVEDVTAFRVPAGFAADEETLLSTWGFSTFASSRLEARIYSSSAHPWSLVLYDDGVAVRWHDETLARCEDFEGVADALREHGFPPAVAWREARARRHAEGPSIYALDSAGALDSVELSRRDGRWSARCIDRGVVRTVQADTLLGAFESLAIIVARLDGRGA